MPTPSTEDTACFTDGSEEKHQGEASDAPSFDLGFDSPIKGQTNNKTEASPVSGLKPVDLAKRFDCDDNWTPEVEKEAWEFCDRVERENLQKKGQVTHQQAGERTKVAFQTRQGLTPVTISTTGTIDGKRRIIRNPPCKRSPYVDYSSKSNFTCSADVTRLYDAIVAHGRRSQRGQTIDTTPVIIEYEKFFVTLQELASSMMPGACLKNTVFELGLESIMLRTERSAKKVVMPLRVAVHYYS